MIETCVYFVGYFFAEIAESLVFCYQMRVLRAIKGCQSSEKGYAHRNEVSP